jgi:predicted nucleic acid-binding protein
MKLFLDSNIIVDAIVNRNSSHESAKLLLALGRLGEFDLWVSPMQWTDLFYILSEGGKRSRSAMVTALLKELRTSVRIVTMGEQEIDYALNLGWPDVEDAVVYSTARTVDPVAIITRNKADFAQSEIPLYTCEELFVWLRDEAGIDYAQIAIE